MTDHGLWFEYGKFRLVHKACDKCADTLLLVGKEAVVAYRDIYGLPKIGWWQRFVIWMGG